MTNEQSDYTALGRLSEPLREPVAAMLDMLRTDLGDAMRSLCVVGSALTRDFHEKYSDINTVLVVSRRSHELLRLLAGYGRKLAKQRLAAPLLMTEEYIAQSCDVFAIEFLDFQFNHLVVGGVDPFVNLIIAKKDVRHQCERQLKAALIKLRQGYISSMGKARPLAELMLACAGELTVLLRSMLWLTDHDRPLKSADLARAASEAFDCDQSKLETIIAMKLSHRCVGHDQVEAMFADLYLITDLLGRRVDLIGDAS